MRDYIYIALIALLIGGCTMPSTTIRSVDSRPSIAITGASSTAELIIDGLNMGKAGTYNGNPQTLTIEPGTHRVTIIENGNVLYDQNIFVESELKTITVR